jgi:hypothetical protein
MGSFYTSHTLRGPSSSDVLAFLKDRSAYVSTSDSPVTVVLDEACESQDVQLLADLGARLSSHFRCPVLAMLNCDDDVLYFELYEDGEKTDEYDSYPAYSGEEKADERPSGGDASRLAAVFGGKDVGAIEAILRRSDYVIETRRHMDLADALGLPKFAVGIGYRYAADNNLPPEISKANFVRT